MNTQLSRGVGCSALLALLAWGEVEGPAGTQEEERGG
jgi:hypothetical protein